MCSDVTGSCSASVVFPPGAPYIPGRRLITDWRSMEGEQPLQGMARCPRSSRLNSDQEPMKHILFFDSACPFPYSQDTLLIPGSKIGGAEATIIRVAQGLSDSYRVSVGQHNRTTHEECPGRNLAWLTKKEATESSLNIDVVVVQRRVADLPLMKRHHPRARLFVWSHDWFNPCPPGFSRMGLAWRVKVETRFLLYARYDAVGIAVSRTHMGNIRESLMQTRVIGGLRNRVHLDYVYNPISDDLDVSPESRGFDPNKLMFFSAPWKGLDIVLQTFNAVRRHLPELTLHVATPGYAPAERSEFSSPENVIFLGSLSHEAVLREVRTALCVFYPAYSIPESFGLVFAESNAVGTPVLAHPFGAAPELLTPEQLVDGRDVDGIVERLRAWRSGARPVVRARKEFRLSNVVRDWERVLFS